MKREELFEVIGGLDEDLLLRSEGRVVSRRNFWEKYGRFAAGVMIAAGAGVSLAAVIGTSRINQDNPKETNDIRKEEEYVGTGEIVFVEPSGLPQYIDVEELMLASAGNKEEKLAPAVLEFGADRAVYYKVFPTDYDKLKAAIGEKTGMAEGWYRLAGHEDIQYLIYVNTGEEFENDKAGDQYSLWKFSSFQKENYAYNDVLQGIYHINAAEDIKEIIVNPASMDNSEEGKSIQEEIGTVVISDRTQIRVIYEVLAGLNCYGSGHWELTGLSGDDSRFSMQNQVKKGRYLTLVTSQGMKIDTLKYTGISGRFYEYEGIAYSDLTEEQKNAVEEILRIDSAGVSEKEVAMPENGSGEITAGENDVPVKEEEYHEARTYSAEITDLQSRISEAMANQKLPFVVTSAIYENPDRVHVTVTTRDEELLAQLRAFDRTGKLLEIVYSEQGPVME